MTVHIIGAGLAGLSCALAAADQGHQVVLHEAARQAGGRCRSWHDPVLDRVIDNGTHMVVGANQEVFDYLRRIGALAALAPGPAALPMLDLPSGALWVASPGKLAGSIAASFWRMPRQQDRPIASALGRSRHYRRFWDPLALAVMNTPSDQASALVFRRVLARTLWRGQAASQPFLARHSLSDAFVAPALAALAQAGVTLHLNRPLRGIARGEKGVDSLHFDGETLQLGLTDQVVLALPWSQARSLIRDLPDLPASPIINAHFRLAEPPRAPRGEMLGLLGGTAQWLFVKDDLVSVTVSGAAALVDQDADRLTERLWRDVARALDLTAPPAASRLIKEKRATLFHSPETEARRPPPRLASRLFLAGDWTATGLPCTVEGSLISGNVAAKLLLPL